MQENFNSQNLLLIIVSVCQVNIPIEYVQDCCLLLRELANFHKLKTDFSNLSY